MASVECMSAIFSRSIIQQASTWKDIFVAVTMIISSSDSVKLGNVLTFNMFNKICIHTF